jgi:peptidoglycan/xylan/chitin deacetylase (PgdA/CDA1 family)
VPRVCFTVDLEPDCPPWLNATFRGVESGTPALLRLFSELGVPATFFTTGEVAEKYPKTVEAVVAAGHELGCHGVTHSAFDTLDQATAEWEIEHSVDLLRTFAPVTSFRAPYLRFPEEYVPLLADAGFTLDSSLAKYKRTYRHRTSHPKLTRIPASVTSSVLRLPRLIRDRWLLSLKDPVVLFVHPWEFVDLRRERIRYDCRFRTGDFALNALREVIELYSARGDIMVPMRELEGQSVA